MVEECDSDDEEGRMAEGGDDNGKGWRIAEGRDATAMRDCDHEKVMEENNVVDELGSCGWKPKLDMSFDSEQATYDFYNNYDGKVGFRIRKSYAHKNKQTKEITSRTFVCYKEGTQGFDKRDPLAKFPRQEGIWWKSNTWLHKIGPKNYLRSKRQKDLKYGEAGSVLQYFCKKTVKNPSFYYAVQLDCEEQISNIFCADAQMIMDYTQFGDVVTFDTTYKLNNEHRPFGTFVGFNHHRETVIFSVALMYDETAESFTWLFQIFLEEMLNKAPKTIFTDQDAAMAKAIPIIMPTKNHPLCTWHLMQNAVKHVSSLFEVVGVKGVFSKFMHEIDDEEEFRIQWEQMLDRYDARNNHWLEQTFGVKEK
ncbi:protein FAR1-RELATED SEQUENCE 12-like [Camellia sinensis]|uniref:protein FAR1-RELATED SEQUENCE 12-like n=1 Tax=Camellia sinensis TaxID=4442 RepID=UPI001035B12C|nr:protein FAR1-RELATED SEQUENCE 12-like [Camellia sinensis]